MKIDPINEGLTRVVSAVGDQVQGYLVFDPGKSDGDWFPYPDLTLPQPGIEDDRLVNRIFGGPIDLHSLGHIIYKMNYGRHMANSDVTRSTREMAPEIRAKMETWVDDPSILEKQLDDNHDNIKDPGLKEIIKCCLLSNGAMEDYLFFDGQIQKQNL